jgi:hypothetical protein
MNKIKNRTIIALNEDLLRLYQLVNTRISKEPDIDTKCELIDKKWAIVMLMVDKLRLHVISKGNHE